MKQNPYNTQRVQQGDDMLLRCRCVNTSGQIVNPIAAPSVDIYNQTGTLAWSGRLPPQNPRSKIGLFMHPLFISSAFMPGQYFAYISWYAAAVHLGEVYRFEVVSGGDSKGQIMAGIWTNQPHVRHIVYETNTGELFKGGNPVVD